MPTPVPLGIRTTTTYQWVISVDFNIIKTGFLFIKDGGILVLMDTSHSLQGDGSLPRHPLLSLSAEELDLVLRLVLASGSLKELAHAYGVTYPTIRARVDRVIARLQQVIGNRPIDPINELLADLVERGEMTYSAAVAVRDLYRKQKQQGEGS
jgi:hypothetical protein